MVVSRPCGNEDAGTDRHVRLSYATSMTELERGLDRIHEFIVKNA